MSSLSTLDLAIKFLAALGCGMMAGVFFAFSTFVMKALAKIPPEAAIPAMQSINVYAVRSLFIVAFMGTTLLCLGVVVMGFLQRGQSAAAWWLAAALSYLVGNFIVTVTFNVPMNNALAAVSSGSPAGAAYWHFYLERWTFWNHVRTLTALVALALFIVAFRLSAIAEK